MIDKSELLRKYIVYGFQAAAAGDGSAFEQIKPPEKAPPEYKAAYQEAAQMLNRFNIAREAEKKGDPESGFQDIAQQILNIFDPGAVIKKV